MHTLEMRDIGKRVFFGEATEKDEIRLKHLRKLLQEDPDAFLSAAGEQIPIMGSILGRGLQTGLTTGLAFGSAAALAGQAGPQVALPEELITVPVAASCSVCR